MLLVFVFFSVVSAFTDKLFYFCCFLLFICFLILFFSFVFNRFEFFFCFLNYLFSLFFWSLRGKFFMDNYSQFVVWIIILSLSWFPVFNFDDFVFGFIYFFRIFHYLSLSSLFHSFFHFHLLFILISVYV